MADRQPILVVLVDSTSDRSSANQGKAEPAKWPVAKLRSLAQLPGVPKRSIKINSGKKSESFYAKSSITPWIRWTRGARAVFPADSTTAPGGVKPEKNSFPNKLATDPHVSVVPMTMMAVSAVVTATMRRSGVVIVVASLNGSVALSRRLVRAAEELLLTSALIAGRPRRNIDPSIVQLAVAAILKLNPTVRFRGSPSVIEFGFARYRQAIDGNDLVAGLQSCPSRDAVRGDVVDAEDPVARAQTCAKLVAG